MPQTDGPSPAEMQWSLQNSLVTIERQRSEIARLQDNPLIHAEVIQVNNKINATAFSRGEIVTVIDSAHPCHGKPGQIISKTVDNNGCIKANFDDYVTDLGIGIPGKTCAQVKLTSRNDGTSIVILVNGQHLSVNTLPNYTINVGDMVLINACSKQIVEIGGIPVSGECGTVRSILDDDYVEVTTGNMVRLARTSLELEIGDRVALNNSNTMVIRSLPREQADEYTLKHDTNVSWADIGGQDEAVHELRNGIENSTTNADDMTFLNLEQPAGYVLHGAPGNGKTLLVRAAATAVAELHGKERMNTGFIFVAGPQLLDKYVGVPQERVREIFLRAEKHYDKHGYPAIIVIDEAPSLLRKRGSGISCDVQDSIVEQFLAKMDGINRSHAIIFLIGNDVRLFDEAVIRPGRCDRWIKIRRPTPDTAHHVIKIHLRNVPLSKTDEKGVTNLLIDEVYDPDRYVYQIYTRDGSRHKLTFGECVSAATLANIIKRAKSIALDRIKVTRKREGVRLEEFQKAVHMMHTEQTGLMDDYAIEEWCANHGLCLKDVQVKTVAGCV